MKNIYTYIYMYVTKKGELQLSSTLKTRKRNANLHVCNHFQLWAFFNPNRQIRLDNE